jgi:acetyl esterase/lipase
MSSPEIHTSPDTSAVALDGAALRKKIDRDYDNGAVFPDVPLWRTTWQERSAEVPIEAPVRLDLSYGPHAMQKLDVFPCGDAAAPTVIFLHGGFWCRNSRETFRYVVRGIHAAGCNAVFVGYRLAPDASLDEICHDARTAGLWVFRQLANLGFAVRPISVVGWSAGAQLAAQMMGEPHIANGIGVSGVYDLRPLVHATLNDTLHLDEASAVRNSPGLNPPIKSGDFLVAYGGRELPAFREQSERFHLAWTASRLPTEILVLDGHHHHSILDELFVPNGKLTAALARMVARS